jgi:hypothetical protein
MFGQSQRISAPEATLTELESPLRSFCCGNIVVRSMKKLLVAMLAVSCFGCWQVQAADRIVTTRTHTYTHVVAVHERFSEPYWYYQKPLPWGTYVTTVSNTAYGKRCYSRLLPTASGWFVPARRCEFAMVH